MMHFDLLRLFAPATATNPSGAYLPYRDKYEAAVVEKCTVTDFIEKVLKDLLEAEDILRKFDTEYHPKRCTLHKCTNLLPNGMPATASTPVPI